MLGYVVVCCVICVMDVIVVWLLVVEIDLVSGILKVIG